MPVGTIPEVFSTQGRKSKPTVVSAPEKAVKGRPSKTKEMPELGGEILMEWDRGGWWLCRQVCVFGSRKLRGVPLTSSISL